MDNITHSLVGVALGSVALRVAPRAAELPKHSKLVIWTAILANNAPDIDVIFPRVFHGGRLMGLLQHRGFTHTVFAAPILSVVVILVAWLVCLGPRLDRKWILGLLGFSTLGVLMHLAADYCNDYGLHPFSPFSNKWIYGDFIFIVEPLIWFSILPLAFFESKKKFYKLLVIALYVLMSGLLIFGPFAPLYVAVFVSLWGIAAWYFQRFLQTSQVGQVSVLRDRLAPVPAVGMIALILCGFYHSSQKVKADLTAILKENRPTEQIVQFARTPAPSDLFCWKAVIVSEGPGDQYVIRSAAVSLLPRWINSETCLHGLDWTHSVKLEPTELPVRNGPAKTASFEVTWQGEFKRELSELGRLNQEFCQFRLLRQFARAPFWAFEEDGWYAGDFRYDRGSSEGFASVKFATTGRDTVCESGFPAGFQGWDPPVPISPTGP